VTGLISGGVEVLKEKRLAPAPVAHGGGRTLELEALAGLGGGVAGGGEE